MPPITDQEKLDRLQQEIDLLNRVTSATQVAMLQK